MTASHCPRIALDIAPNYRAFFNTLLAFGFDVKTVSGATMGDLLVNTIGIAPDFIENEVQTIFHDGKAVDDIDGHCLHADSTVALSAAMPGVFGAAFRKRGRFAAMRQSVSCGHSPEGETARPITVTVKCFNRVAEKLAPDLFSKGIWISAAHLCRFWHNRQELSEKGCRNIRINGEVSSPAKLCQHLNALDKSPVELTVSF
ncbi:MAG: hypothetical protein ACQERN_05785 [Thermodesulfobacteriota bacterium]